MIEISQEEFEQYVIDMIEGRKTRTQAAKELVTDFRTLNNRIQLLSVQNPELYKQYIEAHPYTPKERKDIEAIALAVEILKEKQTIAQIADKFNIGVRTLSRRINTLKESENEEERKIYELCKIVANNHSHSLKNSVSLQIQIDSVLEKYEEMISNSDTLSSLEIKRQELLGIEKEYNELCLKMSKTEAAKQMGYTTNRIYKLLNELYKIEIELQARQDIEQSKQAETVEKDIQKREDEEER